MYDELLKVIKSMNEIMLEVGKLKGENAALKAENERLYQRIRWFEEMKK